MGREVGSKGAATPPEQALERAWRGSERCEAPPAACYPGSGYTVPLLWRERVERFKAVLLLVCTGLVWLGCETERITELRQQQRRLELALVERREIAQNLNERRREVEVLEQQWAQYQLPGAERLSGLVASQGVEVAVKEEGGTQQVHLRGEGGGARLVAALRALAPVERALALRRVAVSPKAWSVELGALAQPLPATSSKPLPPRVAAPRALPEPGLFDSSEGRRLEQQLAMLEQRIAELDKIMAAIYPLNERKTQLEQGLRPLKELKPADRLEGQRAVVEALFGGQRPRLVAGTAELQGERLIIQGLAPKGMKKQLASLAQVGKVLQADEAGVVLALEGR